MGLSWAGLSVGHNRHIPALLETVHKHIFYVLFIHLLRSAAFLHNIFKDKLVLDIFAFPCIFIPRRMLNPTVAAAVQGHEAVLSGQPRGLVLEGEEGSHSDQDVDIIGHDFK